MAPKAEWTVMVYLNAKNSLEGESFQNFAQMAAVGSTAMVNLLVEFGRPKKNHFDIRYGDEPEGHAPTRKPWGTTLRFRVEKGMAPIPENALEDIKQVDLGSGKALADFVQWSQQKFPAKRYMLVIWDHGQGWRAPQGDKHEPLVRYSSIDDDFKSRIYNRDIQDSLAGLPGGSALDVIGFDACLMAMVETAYALRKVGKVLVASEELEPGEGWNYQNWLTPLVANPSAYDAAKLATTVVETYRPGQFTNTTLSALDLSQMDAVAASLDTYVACAQPMLKTASAAFRKARNACLHYGGEDRPLCSIDLVRYLQQVVHDVKDADVATAAQGAITAASKAILDHYASPPADDKHKYGSNGLAIYFPESEAAFQADPDGEGYTRGLPASKFPVEFVDAHRWVEFIGAYRGAPVAKGPDIADSATSFVPLADSTREGTRGPGDRAPDPEEQVDITVHVRRKAGAAFPDDAAIDALGALPIPQRSPLGREAFEAAYGADEADLKAVADYARGAGLTVVSSSAARRAVVLSGTVAALRAAFPVELVQRVRAGGSYLEHIGDQHVPTSLSGIVESIFGFDQGQQARPYFVLPKEPTSRAAHVSRKSYLPTRLAQLYSFPTQADGTGQGIGILEFGGGFVDDDLDAYFSALGVARPPVVAVPVNGVDNAPGSDADVEVMLDIEVAGAVAPGAKIAVYFADFTERGWVDAISVAVHDAVNRPSVLSISWGWGELQDAGSLAWTKAAIKAVNTSLKEAALLGVTVLAAAGDDGSGDGITDRRVHVDFPASSPYILGCGGTKLVAGTSSIATETVWNGGTRANGTGTTGGGVSDVIPVPTWQSAAGVPVSAATSKSGRGVPDVAGDADGNTGYTIRVNGKTLQGVGGTSAVAPLYAGLVARLNQALGAPIGYLNPLLYTSLAALGVCRDITSGNNRVPGTVGGYSAKAGWDACTGWGSINGTKLLSALSAQHPVHGASPGSGTPASGGKGEAGSEAEDEIAALRVELASEREERRNLIEFLVHIGRVLDTRRL